jgi:flagellar biosynthesis/type III secretory pathway M-ring protein FliF/YscJ
MSAVMMLEIVVGIVILAAAVWFAVRETRRLKAAVETEAALVEAASVSERSGEPQAQLAAEPEEATEPEEQGAEQLSEVSATETK